MPELYDGSRSEMHGALASNIAVFQQGPSRAAEIFDVPSLPIEPDPGMSSGHSRIWP
jgi:hypothetical protein